MKAEKINEAIDALEARIQRNVRLSPALLRVGYCYEITANGTKVCGMGLTINDAVSDFLKNYGLEG